MNPSPAFQRAFRGRRFVVTGGLGCIGSNLAHRLGWRPQTTIRQALAKTLAYYRTELPNYL